MAKEEVIELVLPIPPSVNQAYCNAKKGRVKSKKYKEWLDLIKILLLKNPKQYRILGDSFLEVSYKYFMCVYTQDGSKRILDVFNYEKCLSDGLAKNIPGFQDHKILKGSVEKIHSELNEVHIVIKEVKM